MSWELPGPTWLRISLLKQQNGYETSRLRSHIPPERGHGTHAWCSDCTETRLPASRVGKTAPKLICLPERGRNRPAARRAGAAAIKRGQPRQPRSLPATPQWRSAIPPACSSFSQVTHPEPPRRYPRRPRTTRPHLVEAPLGREAVLDRDGPSPLFVPQDHAPCGQCPPVSLDIGPISVGTIAGLHVFTWQPH